MKEEPNGKNGLERGRRRNGRKIRGKRDISLRLIGLMALGSRVDRQKHNGTNFFT
jgi:hypothetical protein